ncbi:MAG: NADH-quinone oxidoreductase subunit NuoH [Planctomycetes bacterium]|nr:NADH-quinone oxidoreductase subunit NuoH [Planctomycetota bacterium]
MPSFLHSPTDKTPTPIDRIIRHRGIVLNGFILLLLVPIPLAFAVWKLAPATVQAVLSSQWAVSLIMLAVSLLIIVHMCAVCILAERKLSAYIQDRLGPNRVGWGGMLQPIADGIKFVLKEEVIPARAEKAIFVVAPCLAFAVSLLGFAIIPWAGEITWPWTDASGNPVTVTTQVASLDIGLLYMLAIGSISVYGVVLAGWASNNKYAHFGGMRATAQMLSYEVPLGLGLLVIILSSGTLRLEEIVNQQATTGVWNIMAHPVAACLVLVAAFAETNRSPFDLAECEQELIAGFHTEYSAMKFALFFLGEYAHMVTASAFLTAIFLGGWSLWPGYDPLAEVHTWWAALIKFNVFWGKVLAVIAFYMLVRWTLPRFRFDQLMSMAWKGLVPIGMVMVIIALAMNTVGLRPDPAKGFAGNFAYFGASLAMNVVVIVVTMAIGARRPPVTGRQPNLPPVQA